MSARRHVERVGAVFTFSPGFHQSIGADASRGAVRLHFVAAHHTHVVPIYQGAKLDAPNLSCKPL